MRKEKDEHKYSIYIHTNKANGKKYIGITRQNPSRRWQKGYGYEKTYFGNAIKKYGWDGFEHEVIGSGFSKEEACSMEIALIAMHRTNEREYGYNVAEGGQTCDYLTGKCGEDHPNHQRVKMIDPKTGDVLRIFGAQAEAARILGISRKGITKACQGKGTATYKGYIWEYADKDYKKPGNPGAGNYKHDKIQRPVRIEFADGTVKEYESLKETREKTGIPSTTLWRYLKNNTTDSKGRRWCYA